MVSAGTERVRRAAGQWPTPEQLVDELAAGLEAAAEREPDSERAGKLRQLGRGMRGALRDVVVDVVGAAAARSMGM